MHIQKLEIQSHFFVIILGTRLVDGPNQYSGRVETFTGHRYFYYNGYYHIQEWGTICDIYQWTIQDATVVCRSLGYQIDTISLQLNQSYGSGTGPIWTRYVSCSGTEYYLWECSYSSNSRSYCDHSTDIGVTCSGKLNHKHIHTYISYIAS